MRPYLLLTAFVVLPLLAAEPPKGDTSRGDRMRDAYFQREVKRLADASLTDIKTKADWEKQRPELHRQFLEMLGLWPMPAKTDLKATITGKLDREKFTVEKLHFQSSPGLYVTGSLYVPKGLKEPAPTILYVCGHGNTVLEKVSYGSKVNYQHHAIWFAEQGYVCLILDTLQLGEIEGIHHGLHREKMWWWQTLGYTPAGIECWNGIRALDYLSTRKEVDPKRFGVTGRSGGGASSWWIGAADERVQCIIPVAGLADLHAHVVEGDAPQYRKGGVITGHCDCMYFSNTYRWDFDKVIALCAPRALMLGNSDVDTIFPVPGYRRPAEKAKRIYELLGAKEKFTLLETKGPHQDTPELRHGAFGWMNRWLKNDTSEIKEDKPERFTPMELRVFDRLPADQINTTVHDTFIKPARIDLPQSPAVAKEWWKGQEAKLRTALKEQVFRGWPEKPPALGVKPAEDVKHNGLRLRAYDFTSEDEVELRLWLLTAEKVEKPTLVVLTSVDEPGWKEFTEELGPSFVKALQLNADPKLDEKKFEQNKKALEFNKWAFATVAPRGIGPTRWSELGFGDKPAGQHIRRRFGLLGQTLDGQRVWDVRRATAALRTLDTLKDVPLWLQGKNDMAGVVLYASIFEPDVARVDLWHPPATHKDGPIFLNVRRHLDMPQAMALAFPHKLRVYVKDDAEAKNWDWPLQLQKALEKDYLQIRKVGN